ncbi:1,9-bis(guanidino)-5-aza-nonane synthase [Chondromyces apiculatus]|uniref:Deoxyhypusine synthase-like protein n=1 Tax=Chondromyces apiculatus DSM 436 TaxID=1192034 RepID=A0A017T7G1_9BACT|nr:deoxyhypusine synthase family protein [Chondromyces apiculatus]EYF05164.1 Deoxyhypusine synthase [Chondromyces apiculatus DSM 436]
MAHTKSDLLRQPIAHIDIKAFDARPIVDAMGRMAFQARNLHRAAAILDAMVREPDGGVILCLAGSLVSAGLKQVIVDMIRHDMVDAIVSTGANIVDQDFFESLGFKHYVGTPHADDQALRELGIDRIYDTFIDEDELRICDMTVAKIAAELEPRPYSSREFLGEMAKYLLAQRKSGVQTSGSAHTTASTNATGNAQAQSPLVDGIVLAAHECGVPIFCPAFSDCSAGFGLVHHQWARQGKPHLSIDSARDFLELTWVKLAAKETGLFMVGGGVPKNFAQDTVVAADLLGKPVSMHKFAVQLTVADERDGALSGSTLREACSWGKVDTAFEQMVYGEATTTMPLIVSHAFHAGGWKGRGARRFAEVCAGGGQ